MDKFRIKRLVPSVILLFLLLSWLSQSACREEPTPAEITYLDTLYFGIKGNEKALNIDEQELVRRKEVIRNRWIPLLKDTAIDVAARMEGDFRGMLTAYDFYLDRYLIYQSSNRLLMEDWEEFKAQTDGKKLSRDEFKDRYAQMRSRLDDNSRRIEMIAKPVYDLEPMWLRYKRLYGEE